MNIQQLISFLEVSRTLNLRKAAETLLITQPALSAQMKNLEEEMGAFLFERSYKGLSLTPAGEIMVRYAGEILQLYEEGKKEIEDLEKEPQGLIRLGSTTAIVLTVIPRMMAYFQNKYPKVKITIDTNRPDQMVDCLLRNELDVVILYGEQGLETLQKQVLYYEQFVVITPPDVELEGLQPKDFCEYPFILPATGTMERRLIDAYFVEKGISPRIVLEVTSAEEIKRMVERNVGFGIIPKSSFRSGVDSVTLLEHPSYLVEVPVALLTKARGYQSLALRKFIEDLLGYGAYSLFD